MEFKDVYQNIDWKSLLLGAGIFAFTVLTAVEYELDILLVFASVGLLYIGYTSENIVQAVILGAIGTIPLVLTNLFFHLITPYTSVNIDILILISFLTIGVFCGLAGSYFKSMRKRAIEEKIKQESIGKGRKKKKKENKNNKNNKKNI